MEQLTQVRPYRDPGITRTSTPDGVAYRLPDGSPPDASTLSRIDALALPPAWTDVWISTDPHGRIQAVGVDAAGREQYRYHPAWRAAEAEHKFDRMLDLAEALPAARSRVTRDLGHTDDPRQRLLATAFRFLDDAAPRVGSVGYLEEYGSRGLTTLLQQHAQVDGHHVQISFPAKSHQHDVMRMTDADLADVVGSLLTGDPTARLLAWQQDGTAHHLSESAVNDYVRDVAQGRYTAKDFRTLRGTVVAAESLARTGPQTRDHTRHEAEVRAAKAASEALQNTPAVARSSYIDPRLFTAYADGRVLDLERSADTGLRGLLEG